jgi:hypothetical protein
MAKEGHKSIIFILFSTAGFLYFFISELRYFSWVSDQSEGLRRSQILVISVAS